jgi:hypothetical protein
MLKNETEKKTDSYKVLAKNYYLGINPEAEIKKENTKEDEDRKYT